MPSRSLSPKAVGLLCLLVTVVGWGLNWPIIKVILREWPPLFGRGVAGLIGAAALVALALWRGERLVPPARALPRLAAAAFTNVFAWMGFTTVAMLWISVAEGALLVYTMPLWVMVLDWPLRGRRPSRTNLLSLALGFGGLALLLGGEAGVAQDGTRLAGAGLALVAAIIFAAGTILARPIADLQPVAATAWQIGLACLPMTILGLVFERSRIGPLGAGALGALAYMALLPMGACYLTWFAALRRLPAATASMATLLTPIVGIVSATVLVGEALGPREIAAIVLTLGGTALALKPTRRDVSA